MPIGREEENGGGGVFEREEIDTRHKTQDIRCVWPLSYVLCLTSCVCFNFNSP